MILIDIVITCLIEYELDEFELNWMNVYLLWYSINVCEWYGMVIKT